MFNYLYDLMTLPPYCPSYIVGIISAVVIFTMLGLSYYLETKSKLHHIDLFTINLSMITTTIVMSLTIPGMLYIKLYDTLGTSDWETAIEIASYGMHEGFFTCIWVISISNFLLLVFSFGMLIMFSIRALRSSYLDFEVKVFKGSIWDSSNHNNNGIIYNSPSRKYKILWQETYGNSLLNRAGFLCGFCRKGLAMGIFHDPNKFSLADIELNKIEIQNNPHRYDNESHYQNLFRLGFGDLHSLKKCKFVSYGFDGNPNNEKFIRKLSHAKEQLIQICHDYENKERMDLQKDTQTLIKKEHDSIIKQRRAEVSKCTLDRIFERIDEK